MSQTALYPWLASEEARTGTYNGVETALSFGSPANEQAALRSGCGVFSLAWQDRINVTGKDRVRWLHNIVTNNVKDFPVDRGNYNFVLNAQGRILGDMYIFNRGESLVLETDSAQVEPLITAMKRFIIMDKVEMVPADKSVAALGICGPTAARTLAEAGINALELQPLEVRERAVNGVAITVFSDLQKKANWFEVWMEATKAPELWTKLIAAGAQPVGAEALEMWRVLCGIPNYGQDIRERDLPQETEQMQALNFTKGCYIG